MLLVTIIILLAENNMNVFCETQSTCSYCDLVSKGFTITPRVKLHVFCAKKSDNTCYFVIAKSIEEAKK